MSKSNQIKKLVNGEIADADDVNQIVENAGAEGGSIPYDPTSHERETNGSESLGSTEYPWGSFHMNQDSEVVEVDTASHTAASSIAIKNLRKFITLKDTPAEYTGKSGYFVAVKSTEDQVEFVNPPTKSNMIFCWNGSDSETVNGTDHTFYSGDNILPVANGATVNYNFYEVWGSTYRTILLGKFVKTAGISTITINARLWGDTTGSDHETYLKADIGGQNNTVKSVTSITPTWVTASTVDVSGLSNGTTYNITIQIMNEGGSGYCSAVVLTGD